MGVFHYAEIESSSSGPSPPPYLYLKAPFYGAFLLSVVSVPPYVPPLSFCVILLYGLLRGMDAAV